MMSMHRQDRRGHSLIELLICVAIIGILMALYLPVLSKAKAKAMKVASGEAHRQQHIGRAADNANSAGSRKPATKYDRATCRAAFRQSVGTSGDEEAFIAEVLYVVSNEKEFEAYWETLLNPAATDPLEYDGGALIAKTAAGETVYLRPVDDMRTSTTRYPVQWDFISTDLSETSMTGLGINVLYSDGRVEYERYPGAYPACALVARLSHRFMVE